jgi:signal transduction histidine kinase/ActR/RegA family two-component response regulator
MCDATVLAPDLLLLRLSGGPDAESRERAFRSELFSLNGMTADAAQPETAGSLSERATSRLELLNAFIGALAKAITPPDVVETIVEMGMAATSARSGGLWFLSEDGKVACLARGVGPTGPRAEDYAEVPLDQPTRMPILDAMQDSAPVWIESCAELEERYPEMFRAFSLGGESSLACLPLLAQGRCIGGLALNYDGARRFLEDERTFLQVLSKHCVLAVERARLYAAEKRARVEAEVSHRRSVVLARAGALLSSTLDYSATLAAIAEAAVPALADWCIVELVEEPAGAQLIAAHADPAKVPFVLELSRRFRQTDDREMGIAGVIRSGKSRFYPFFTAAQIREGMKNSPELAELYVGTGAVSSMVVPIFARGRTLGAILLNRADPERLYDEHDLKIAEELGQRVGLAVDNARLFRNVQEADRLKDEFLAMLSHELRNPLAAIRTTLDVMRLRGDEALARERAILTRQVGHLVRLVDDLLDVSRITHGKIQLETVRCEGSEVIAHAVEIARPLLEERAHHLSVSAPERGMVVMADPERLVQAIANLLVNAAKYTERGGRITVVASSEGSEAVIRVRDSGSGIAPDVLPNVFELFVQGKSSLDRGQGGLGIGLTVVKSIVELHGGSVSAHSDGPGRGSEFIVRLPLTANEAATPGAAPPPDARGPAAVRLRVIVVDDNPDAADMLGQVLDVLGCSVRVAHDGASALALDRELTPDCMLMDIGLPDIDGYELACRFRQSDSTASTTLIAVTGYGQDSDRLRAQEAGFSEHLVKPVELESLQRVLDRIRREMPATQ